MLHVLLAIGILLMPWRHALYIGVLVSMAAGIGVAVCVLAALGWVSFLKREWDYA